MVMIKTDTKYGSSMVVLIAILYIDKWIGYFYPVKKNYEIISLQI